MSRSYKKKPWATDGKPKSTKESKRIANSVVRQADDDNVYNGGSFKKLSCSYDIHDYKSRWTWEEALFEYEHDDDGHWHKRCPTVKDFHRFWIRYYRRK